MSYKQNNNPGKIKYGPSSYENPRGGRFKATEFRMPDLDAIYNVGADGTNIQQDVSTDDGSKEGKKDDKTIPSQNDPIMKKVERAENLEALADKSTEWKQRKKTEKRERKGINKAIRSLEKGQRKGWTSSEDDKLLEELQKERQTGLEFQSDKDEEILPMKTIKAQPIENIRPPRKVEKLFNPNLPEFEVTTSKPGVSMYEKQENMKPKNLSRMGSSIPYIQQDQMQDGMQQAPNRAGRPANSNILANDPTIQQPDNKVPASAAAQNNRMANIASSAGQLYNDSSFTPNKPGGGLDSTFTPPQQEGMAMYGPNAAKPDFLDLDGDGDKNEPMKEAAPGMYGPEYGKYGAAKKKDELPVMKSAGDKKKYLMGGDNLYHKGKEFSPEHTGAIKRGLLGKYVKDEDTGEKMRLKNISTKPSMYDAPASHARLSKGHYNNLSKDADYDKKEAYNKNLSSSARLHDLENAMNDDKRLGRGPSMDHGPSSFKKVASKIARKQGISNKAASAILASSTRKASASAKRKNPNLKKVKGKSKK